jgi:hypothetical protein
MKLFEWNYNIYSCFSTKSQGSWANIILLFTTLECTSPRLSDISKNLVLLHKNTPVQLHQFVLFLFDDGEERLVLLSDLLPANCAEFLECLVALFHHLDRLPLQIDYICMLTFQLLDSIEGIAEREGSQRRSHPPLLDLVEGRPDTCAPSVQIPFLPVEGSLLCLEVCELLLEPQLLRLALPCILSTGDAARIAIRTTV